MEYKSILIFFIIFSLASSSYAGEDIISPATLEKYRQVKASLEETYKSKAGAYAKELLDNANMTIAKASAAIEAKKEKATLEAIDVAALQIELAKVKTEERIASEITAVTRHKVDKLSQHLDEILSGKGAAK